MPARCILIITTTAHLSSQDFLAPGDLATIYDINTLYNLTPAIDGTGQKLAIIGQTDVFLTDLNDFRSGFGLSQITGCTSDSTSNLLNGCTTSSTANFQYVLVSTDPNAPSQFGDITEADLDLEWSSAIARGAQIIYVNAPIIFSGNTYVSGGVTEAWYTAVADNIAPVISLSYGSCEFDDNFVLDASGNPLADEMELMQANSQGITFFNSSGDSGAAGCDGGTNTSTTPANLAVGGLAVSYPAASPEVTGVGGTAVDFTTGFSSTYWGTSNGTDGGTAQNPPIPETSWNDDEELATAYGSATKGTNTASYWQENYAIVASGGGPSNCAVQSADNATCVAGFGQPSWQTVTLSGQAPARFSPDVSLLGSPNFPGYIFCTPQNWWVSGSSNTASTCVSGISGALSLTDTSGQPNPSLVGGTSASAPIMAGILTLVNQYLGTTTGLGNINPTLYTLASTPSNGVFHKATTGDNKVYCEVGQPAGTTTDPWPTAMQCPSSGVFGYSASTSDSTTGYNMVTGLGSVDAANLASNWSAASSTAGSSVHAESDSCQLPGVARLHGECIGERNCAQRILWKYRLQLYRYRTGVYLHRAAIDQHFRASELQYFHCAAERFVAHAFGAAEPHLLRDAAAWAVWNRVCGGVKATHLVGRPLPGADFDSGLLHVVAGIVRRFEQPQRRRIKPWDNARQLHDHCDRHVRHDGVINQFHLGGAVKEDCKRAGRSRDAT